MTHAIDRTLLWAARIVGLVVVVALVVVALKILVAAVLIPILIIAALAATIALARRNRRHQVNP